MRRPTFNTAIFLLLFGMIFFNGAARADTSPQVVVLGFNYPQTGPYGSEGEDQLRGASLAVDEINAAGGVLGRKVLLEVRDSASDVLRTRKNIETLLGEEGAKMIFGGVSSAVAITSCAICQEHQIPFFGTLTYSTATTTEEGHRFCFRECYDVWMAARIIATHLDSHAKYKRFFYISADYTWGWTAEESLRELTGTTDTQVHPGVRSRLGTNNFISQLRTAMEAHPDVLVLALFGSDLINCLRQATVMGFKERCLVVVPNLTLGMAKGAGPKAMQGVIGAVPWSWRIPYLFNYSKGIAFVEAFKRRYNTYPSTAAASAFTIVHEYKDAVERTGSFDGAAIVRALEGHPYQWAKDPQTWRNFDHQSIQTVYLVKGKPPDEVDSDPYQLDYFEMISFMPGEAAARSHGQWQTLRGKAGKPLSLERLSEE